MTILQLILAYLALSVVVTLLLGRFIAVGSGDIKSNRKSQVKSNCGIQF